MKYSKKQLLDNNKFKLELVKLKQSIEKNAKVRDYDNWVSTTNALINEINRKIRSIKD